MLVPSTRTISQAIQHDLAILGHDLQLLDDLSADLAQVSGPRLDGNACTFTLSGQIEEVSDDVLDAMRAALMMAALLLTVPARSGTFWRLNAAS
jgi:hypothetical protein